LALGLGEWGRRSYGFEEEGLLLDAWTGPMIS